MNVIREYAFVSNSHVELTLPEFFNNSEVEITISPKRHINKISNTKKRPLGLLKGKANFKIHGNFSITDNELISL
ncbi:hypothetical protein MHK_003892 [Candidatus Magnetomorum sp. HK-1]|nr:hypothetical protein MHK_003892 [Candidatus Magnetomorum sp. HK-1]